MLIDRPVAGHGRELFDVELVGQSPQPVDLPIGPLLGRRDAQVGYSFHVFFQSARHFTGATQSTPFVPPGIASGPNAESRCIHYILPQDRTFIQIATKPVVYVEELFKKYSGWWTIRRVGTGNVPERRHSGRSDDRRFHPRKNGGQTIIRPHRRDRLRAGLCAFPQGYGHSRQQGRTRDAMHPRLVLYRHR